MFCISYSQWWSAGSKHVCTTAHEPVLTQLSLLAMWPLSCTYHWHLCWFLNMRWMMLSWWHVSAFVSFIFSSLYFSATIHINRTIWHASELIKANTDCGQEFIRPILHSMTCEISVIVLCLRAWKGAKIQEGWEKTQETDNVGLGREKGERKEREKTKGEKMENI